MLSQISLRVPIREAAGPLQALLTRQMAAYVANAKEPDTVRAWFIGMCPQLGDISPVRAIHGGSALSRPLPG
jgi:hypothetical protein